MRRQKIPRRCNHVQNRWVAVKELKLSYHNIGIVNNGVSLLPHFFNMLSSSPDYVEIAGALEKCMDCTRLP